MNSAERTQVAALQRFVHFGEHYTGRTFSKQMYWLLKNEAKTSLTPRQKFMLQGLCYRYRRQLAGRVHDDLIPTDPPREEDFITEPVVQQGDLGL